MDEMLGDVVGRFASQPPLSPFGPNPFGFRRFALQSAIAGALLLAGCQKETQTQAPPPPQPLYQPASGSCDCPYDTASDGTECGERSAYSRAGGEEPVCYLEPPVG